MDRSEVTDTALFPFCSFLTEKAGITFEKNRQEHLRNAIATRLDALHLIDPKEYFSILQGACGENPEFSTLIDLLTIRESFFFRHRAQYETLKNHCLPRILKKKGAKGPIHIWSAGCANGEEAYSIAMVVRDLIPAETNGREVLIRATDISPDALIQAKKGEYSERAIRELEPSQVVRFFLKKGSRYFLKNEIKSLVHFEYFNLAAKHFPLESMPLWDLIFCRNVIIYFGEEPAKRLIRNFYLALADGGYFFPGYSETLRYLNDDFVSMEQEGAFIYQKKLGEKASEIAARPRAAAEKGKEFTLSPKKFSATIAKTETRKAENKKIRSVPSPFSERRVSEKEDIGKGASIQVDAILALAREHADQGKTMEAVELLGDLIASAPLCEKAYFLLGMIYRNTGDPQQAIRYLKKVAYLDSANPVVRLHLADVYREALENRDAAREYTNVITLLKGMEEPQTNVVSEGFSKETLMETARAHLQSIQDHRTDTI